MALALPPHYCQSCGGALVRPPAPLQGGAPFVCSQCGLKVYLDPKVAVASVVRREGKVVLLRRAQRDAAFGRWILPGGHVDRGEDVKLACLREVSEETGLAVKLEGLLNIYSYPGNPVVLIVYLARPTGGELIPGREALEVRAFAPAEIPWGELGYPSTGQALREALGLAAGELP